MDLDKKLVVFRVAVSVAATAAETFLATACDVARVTADGVAADGVAADGVAADGVASDWEWDCAGVSAPGCLSALAVGAMALVDPALIGRGGLELGAKFARVFRG